MKSHILCRFSEQYSCIECFQRSGLYQLKLNKIFTSLRCSVKERIKRKRTDWHWLLVLVSPTVRTAFRLEKKRHHNYTNSFESYKFKLVWITLIITEEKLSLLLEGRAAPATFRYIRIGYICMFKFVHKQMLSSSGCLPCMFFRELPLSLHMKHQVPAFHVFNHKK